MPLFLYEDKNMSVTNKLDIEIKAESKKATPSLDAMIAKLKEVDSALDSLNPQKLREISDAVKSMKGAKINLSSGGNGANSVKALNNQYAKTNSLLNTLTATANKANKGFLGLNGTMFKLAATWGMFYASAYPFIKLLNKAWTSTQSAMDYVETYNYYKVTMDKIFKQVAEDEADTFQTNYIKSLNDISEKMTGFKVGINGELFENFSKNLGADPNALMNYQARIGAVTNAVGLLTDESVNAQKALSMLSQDLSSLTNTDLESVMTNLQSGLIGQSRALYKYGIDITQATLKTYALKYGVTQAVSSMTQAQKMELRLLAILDQSKVAWGDMANTVGSVANQYRIFGQSVSNLSRVLGNLFLPIISKVLPYVNALLISLRQVFSMLGFKLYGNNWLKDSLDGISGGYSGVEDIADAFDDVENSANGAGKAAKKLKTALMGFDELNIINDQSNSGGSGSGGGGGWDLSDAIADALGDYESVWNKAFADAENKAAELAKRITGFFRTENFEGLGKWISYSIKDQLDSINWESVYSGAKNFGTGLAQFMNGLIQPSTFASVGKTVASSINTAIYFALSFGETFDFKKLGDSIAAYWNAIFDTFDWGSFGKMVGVWVGGITKTIATAIKNIHWDDLLDGFKEGLNGFFKGIAESGVTIGDVAIVLGALTIKKILKFAWGAAAIKAISQTLAKGLAARIGIDLAADATLGTAIAQGISVSLSSVPGKLKGMWAVLGGTDEITNETITLSKAFSDAFGGIATKVVGIGSVIGGTTLAIHEFFDMWSNGWDVLSEILKDMGIAIAGVGAVLLGLVSGPVALVIGGIAALGSTLLILAHNQLPDVGEVIYSVLSNPGGTSIAELTANASDRILSIGDAFSTLSTTVENNERIKTSLEETSNSILQIQHSMELGTTSVEEGVDQISQLFATLQNNTQEYYSGIATTILDVYGEGGVLEGAFENYQEVAQNTVLMGKELTEEQQKYYEEYLAMEDKTSEQALELLRKAIGTKDEVTQAMDDAKNNINAIIGEIDWSKFFDSEGNLIDEEGFKAELDKVTNAIQQSQAEVDQAITDWNSELYAAMDEAIAAGNTELAASYQAMIDTNNASRDDLKNQIAMMGQEVTDAMQIDFLGKMQTAISQADSDQAAYNIATQMSSSLDTISGTIEEKMSEIGIQGAGWGAEANEQIMNSLFDWQQISGYSGAMTPVLTEEWQNTFSQVVTDVSPIAADATSQMLDQAVEGAKEKGGDVAQGFADGISAATSLISNTANIAAQTFDDSFHDSVLQFGSPSRRMGEYAQWTVDGYNNRLSEYAQQTTPQVMNAWGQTIVESFGTAFTDAFEGITKTWDDLVPYFENDVFENLNSALDEELSYISESVTTNYESFIELTTTTYEQYTTMTTELTTAMVTTFDETTTSISDMFETMWGAIKQSSVVNANSIVGVFEGLIGNLADGVNNFLSSVEAELRAVANETGSSFSGFGRVSRISIPRLSINAYRTGGFPEDGLFFANHNELVGQFSNGQTAVANNEQIVEGIRYGVASAVREELGLYLRDIADNTSATASNTEDIKNKPSQTIGDRNVARAAIRGSRSMGLTIRTT